MSFLVTYHTEHILRAPQWARCRNCYGGEDAIHSEGETYLPKLDKQTVPQYNAYKLRARFFNAFRRTVSGHTGLVFRTPVQISVPDNMTDIVENIDINGSDISAYIKQVVNNVLQVGRHGTLVDYSVIPGDGVRREGSRPYWISYRAEDIVDWDFSAGVLTHVVLREFLNKHDEFAKRTKYMLRYRVLELVDGVYTQNVYVIHEAGNTELMDTYVPQIDGGALTFIPFVFHEEDFLENTNLPPLLDLANLNLSHYRLKADHMHALHYVALPTPWITGMDPNDKDAPSAIGPQELWLIENPEAAVGMLEFSGAGLGAIQAELSSMEEQLAQLGARMLMTASVDPTATSTRLNAAAESADLSGLVGVLNTQFQRLLDFTADWAGVDQDVVVHINQNFVPPEMTPQMLTALVSSWQQGAYTFEVLTRNLQRSEIVSPDQDPKELLEAVEKEQADMLLKSSAGITGVVDTVPIAE